MPPRVTALRPAGPGRLLVELEGVDWRVLPAEVVVRCGLAKGTVLDRPALRQLRSELRHHDALEVALRALARRDLSERLLLERLRRAGVAPRVSERVRETLANARLLDDRRFAHARARALADREAGDLAIRHDLERQGLPRESIEEALAQLPAERERAELAGAARKGVSRARYLARKGFTEESIEAVVSDLVAGDGRSSLA